MNKFVRSLITEWRKLDLPFSGETIVVAVSGGADSMSLLLAVHDLVRRKKLGHRIIAAHFNHKLRGEESDADEKFAKENAERLDLEFVSASGRLPKTGNLEQAARDARYKFLSKVAERNNALAVLTAHTQNDQAETVLFNLIRGSGPDGLAGMRSSRELTKRSRLVRPLLSWAARADTEQFCRENGLDYRTDSMNSDEKFTRVRIRRQVLPALADINPKIVQTLARTAEVMRKYADVDPPGAGADEPVELAIKDLTAMEPAELTATLRQWLRSIRGNLRSLQLKHIEAIERLIPSRKSGNTVELPGGGRVVKGGGRLRFKNIKVEK